MKKFLCILLSVILAFPALCLPVFARDRVSYTVTDPYREVNWDTWQAYKFQPHCHTNASDGYLTVKESVQLHYDYDYDVLAITDHGTLNQGWDKAPDTVPLMRLIKKERTGMADIVPLTDEEYAAYLNGTALRSDGSARENGMLDVPKGIELNLATPVADCHLTGYWSDYGQGLAGVFGDYETPSAGVKKAGGISMLSHVGEFVYTDKDSEAHAGQPVDEYYANKFARIFLDNAGSGVGMGINSATDAHTRCDRILYDQILQKTIPNGVTPWAFCFSDSHNETSVNDAYTMLYMPALTVDNVRSCMENGQLFAVSHYSNGVELNGMPEIPGYKEEDVDWQSNETPLVTRVTVDDENDKIYVEGENFHMITWVSDGQVVLRESDITDGKAVLDLNDEALLDDISLFIRFYIVGDNGICYSQPFTVLREGETLTPVTVPVTNDISTKLRTLVTVLDWLMFKFNPVIWLFKYFALGYDPIDQATSSVRDVFTGQF